MTTRRERPQVFTTLCDLLGVDSPVPQAPIQAAATPRLVGATRPPTMPDLPVLSASA